MTGRNTKVLHHRNNADISSHYTQYRREGAPEDIEQNWHEGCEDRTELMILLLAVVLSLDLPRLSHQSMEV